ncbi:Serine/threonine-protein kinase LMTK2 [Merluccius polli]|uniref:non-specific serine/threonine protein kinase n=1 Tax=Merluccius polli TaxID=89951 RepID=A0AA47NNV2_MERPO|nr:Serine/threonine-protein kinase LMTK2 [Merluccius polli]
MESRRGRVLLLGGLLLSERLLCGAAPLQYFHRSGDSGGNALSLSVYLPLVVSLTLLVVLTVLLVNCVTCCKEREINFKEFDDHFDDEIDFTPPAEDTPSMQSPVEVYTLAVPPVALPGPPHLQPQPHAPEGSAGSLVARHSLSYIQEIGNGLFGKVLLSEIYTDPGVTRVVVKELNANASAKEQNSFLQQGDPYRVLQHPHILQCLGQCVEAIPFLLVFEYCEMGDLRGYVSQQDWMFRNAELLELQRMACEIAAGVTHLHKHNFLHSDLALRNCYLTVDLTVKVGDYGIGPHRYKEDYIVTEDDVFAPLRWLAPELVGERYGGVVTTEQTKPSNVWALGVTLWELFENGAQPYSHLSDREVLNHVIKEQQIKPFKPQLELPYSDRWYEVLQFCWLSPDKRATAEEGQKDIEEDFEQRWDALKPNPTARQTTVGDSSFPILDQFADDALRQEIDEVLTVTETSKGLSFEYVWEAAKHDHYETNVGGRSGMDTTLNYHSMFYPVSTEDIQAHFPDPTAGTAGTNSSSTSAGIPGILPVFNAQKPTRGNEYFIQLEEQGESVVGENGNAGPSVDPSSARQEFVVLQDVLLEESSTDADFFHQSIDSKDSFLPDSHVWSSLENDSPYHTNIFTEDDSKQEDSLSWRRSFMELPERGTNPFLDTMTHETPAVDTDENTGGPFLGVRPEATRLTDPQEGNGDVNRLLNENLEGNFLFLKENNLMREGSSSIGKSLTPPPSFLSPGVAHVPEESFKMRSWDHIDTLGLGLNMAEPNFKPFGKSISPSQDSSSSLGDVCESLVENETAVPSIVVITDDVTNDQLLVKNSLSAEDFSLMCSTDTGIESGTSNLLEAGPVSPTENHSSLGLSECATVDLLSTDAITPELEDDRGTSEGRVGVFDVDHPYDFETTFPDNGHSEALTSDDFFSELIDDTEAELETVLSDHEESFMDDCSGPPTRSSLLVSGPSLDQISQDSLLEDSVSTTLPTVDNSAETPDSLDSLDIHRLGGQVKEVNGLAAPEKLRPPYKVADSGYETENLESPEWSSEPLGRDQSPVENGISVPKEEEENAEKLEAAASLVPPEIIISEVESALGTQNEENEEDENQPPEHIDAVGEPFVVGSYRDSAYFSDNESEPEKKLEEVNVVRSAAETLWPNATDDVSGSSGGSSAEVMVEEYMSTISKHESSAASAAMADIGGALVPQGEGSSAELDSESKEDLVKEATESTGGHNEDLDNLDLNKSSALSESDHRLDDPESASHIPALSATSTKPPPSENMAHPKLTRTYARDSTKIKERDAEGRFLGRRETDGQEDGMDADEEDENSDDSDDDVRAYRLHDSSSESEDDTVHPVPLIISDDSAAKNLKSLLKPTTLNVALKPLPTPATGTQSDSSRRAVSFFDDVTVYLFDQETPTKELGDHSAGSSSQVSEFSSPVPTASYLNRFTNSESSTDEEGGGFEWDDYFSSTDSSFLSKASSSSEAASSFFSPPPATGRKPEATWTPSPNYSRFSISPASIASFSLTHLTDSDIEQGGKLMMMIHSKPTQGSPVA